MNEEEVKVTMIGSAYVGKTSLILRFINNEFSSETDVTIHIGCYAKNLELGEPVKVNIFDTAGTERFQSLAPIYFRGSHAVLFVYDICSEDSFNQLAKIWVPQLANVCDLEKMPVFIVGNKTDQLEENNISGKISKVSPGQVTDLATKIRAIQFETSAKTGHNVNKLFVESSRKALEYKKTIDLNKNTNSLMLNSYRSSSCC